MVAFEAKEDAKSALDYLFGYSDASFLSEQTEADFSRREAKTEQPRRWIVGKRDSTDTCGAKTEPLRRPSVGFVRMQKRRDRLSFLQNQNKFRMAINKAKRKRESIVLPLKKAKITERRAAIIFDWDDTLFPTAVVRQKGGVALFKASLSKEERDQLKLLDFTVTKLLRRAKQLTPYVSVVSNGTLRWLKRSASEVMPRTYDLLFREKLVEVLSARDMFESVTNKPMKYKVFAFQHMLSKQLPTGWLTGEDSAFTLLSIGDGAPEYTASIEMGKKFENCKPQQLVVGVADSIEESLLINTTLLEDIALSLPQEQKKCRKMRNSWRSRLTANISETNAFDDTKSTLEKEVLSQLKSGKNMLNLKRTVEGLLGVEL